MRLEATIRKNLYDRGGEPCVWWGGTWWSRGAIDQITGMCEQVLRRGGFKQGCRLGIALPNSPMFIAATLAAWRLGGSIVPVSPSCTAGYVANVLSRCGVCGAVVPSGRKDIAEELIRLDIPAMSYSGSGEMPDITLNVTQEDNPDIAAIFHTAGITGPPKAVPLTHDAINFSVKACLAHVHNLDGEEIFLNALPDCNILGFTVCTILPLINNYPQVMTPSFPPQTVLKAAKASGATVMIAVPAMLSFIVGSMPSVIPASMRLILSGGNRLPAGLNKRCARTLGIGVLEGYGLTEAAGVVSVNSSYHSNRPGTVGRPLPGLDVRIADGCGYPVEAENPGRLWIRGPSVSNTYLNDSELSAQTFVDGWFDTGDVASLDTDGYLTIVSRASRNVIINGVVVSLDEVERVLCTCGGVLDATVCCISGGGALKATVSAGKPAPSSRDLVLHCRKHLCSRSVPMFFDIVGGEGH